MTALNCFLDSRAAHVFTDSVLYDLAAAKVAGFMTKVLPVPMYGSIVATSGNAVTATLIVGAIAETAFESFDDLADHFEAFMRTTLQKSSHVPWGHFECVIAGWGNREDRPRALVFTKDTQGTGGHELTRFTSPKLIGFQFDSSKAEASGIALVTQQRTAIIDIRDPNLKSAARNPHAIGGVIQYTRVERDAVTIKVLRRWPDKIGEPIDPRATPEGSVRLF